MGVYAWEPMPPNLSPAEQRHMLGVQGQLWTEYMPTAAQVEYMAFPRLAALAEAGWTPASERSYDGFRERLFTHLVRLHYLHVNFRPLDKEP